MTVTAKTEKITSILSEYTGSIDDKCIFQTAVEPAEKDDRFSIHKGFESINVKKGEIPLLIALEGKGYAIGSNYASSDEVHDVLKGLISGSDKLVLWDFA